MAQLDFYALAGDLEQILEFVFDETDYRVFEVRCRSGAARDSLGGTRPISKFFVSPDDSVPADVSSQDDSSRTTPAVRRLVASHRG